MRFSALKSVGHNIADSLASGIGLMVGLYEMDVFAEAIADPTGYIEVDFLHGTYSGTVSPKLRRAIILYKNALPDLCAKHGVKAEAFRALQARFGVDRVYGPHFTVTVEDALGKRSVDRYIGVPGRRSRRRKA